jgi:hypothetical protein
MQNKMQGITQALLHHFVVLCMCIYIYEPSSTGAMWLSRGASEQQQQRNMHHANNRTKDAAVELPH